MLLGMTEGGWDVFVSYGHEDAGWVRALAGNLHRAGFDLPRAFRTADLWLIHAADCRSRYSSWTCCGVRY